MSDSASRRQTCHGHLVEVVKDGETFRFSVTRPGCECRGKDLRIVNRPPERQEGKVFPWGRK